jgi:hypothetical protein
LLARFVRAAKDDEAYQSNESIKGAHAQSAQSFPSQRGSAQCVCLRQPTLRRALVKLRPRLVIFQKQIKAEQAEHARDLKTAPPAAPAPPAPLNRFDARLRLCRVRAGGIAVVAAALRLVGNCAAQ